MAKKEKSFLESIADMGSELLAPKPKKPKPVEDEAETINERTGLPFGKPDKKK